MSRAISIRCLIRKEYVPIAEPDQWEIVEDHIQKGFFRSNYTGETYEFYMADATRAGIKTVMELPDIDSKADTDGDDAFVEASNE